MKAPTDETTINLFSARSDISVMCITLAFALGGALADLASHLLLALMGPGASMGMLWGLWIPLCFLTIPPIHFLCRKTRQLQNQVAMLEQRLTQLQTSHEA